MTKWILDEENNLVHEDDDRHTIICNFPCTLKNQSMKADALKIVAVPELLEALQEYVLADEMTNYGDASDFVWPKVEMRRPGEPAWGWVCEKHGLGYQSGCICCHDEYLAHKERKDDLARYARDDALHDARKKARAAIAKATGA
jgi:hypothetical protein